MQKDYRFRRSTRSGPPSAILRNFQARTRSTRAREMRSNQGARLTSGGEPARITVITEPRTRCSSPSGRSIR